MKATGFAKYHVFEESELDAASVKEKEQKISFLQKTIDFVEFQANTTLEAKPSKIVAGLEADKTNDFLLTLHKVATAGGVDWEAAGKKFRGIETKEEAPKKKAEPKKEDPNKKKREEEQKRAEQQKRDEEERRSKEDQLKADKHQKEQERIRREKEKQRANEEQQREREQQQQMDARQKTNEDQMRGVGGMQGFKMDRPSTAGRAPPKQKQANVEITENKSAMPTGIILENQQEDTEEKEDNTEDVNIQGGVNIQQVNAEQ